jgi:VanZ family protein
MLGRVGARARWGVAVAVAAAILVASVAPPGPTAGEPLVLFGIAEDKWLHAVAYAVLAAVVGWAFLVERPVPVALSLAVLVAVVYGVGMEFVQAPLPVRRFSVADMVADGAGAVLGAGGLRALVAIDGSGVGP